MSAGTDSDGGSRPSKNNCHAAAEAASPENLVLEPDDIPNGAGLRPISVEAGRSLRDEAVLELSNGPQARQWYRVLNEWRDWYDGYRRAHIEFEDGDGNMARTELENSYQPEYGKRYYAKLKDLERGVSRSFEEMATVMLTFTASHENAKGGWRCPADHMRDIMEGYDAARKQLHKALDGHRWEYARVWEPHADGYGHLHLAVFVEADSGAITPEQFGPVMRSHVENCGPAGSDAHAVEGDDAAVSVNDDVENLGSYISEYIGIFGEETLNRPLTEQMFYAVTWATGTRRVDFSNGAQEIMKFEQFRRETGLTEADRGGREAYERWKAREAGVTTDGDESDHSADDSDGWTVDAICTVRGSTPSYSDPTSGGVDCTPIEGRDGVDPPPVRE